ncbi:hypothetical protein KKB44_05470 [Candidatus Micrarchaeota archaeon]|nr:hypothetical protein [Candidatus Micrarchaeota archaeon]
MHLLARALDQRPTTGSFSTNKPLVDNPTMLVNPNKVAAREQGLKSTITVAILLEYCVSNGQLPNSVPLRNRSSGNFPECFPGICINRLRRAMGKSLSKRESGAYGAGVQEARKFVSQYYGRVPPHQIFFTAGISGGIEYLYDTFLGSTGGKVLIPNASYPTHFASAISYGGIHSVVTVDRTSAGLPDFSSCTNGDNPFAQVNLSSFIPFDNPIPIRYPRSFFRNGGTGIFDLNEAAQTDGVIRPIILDWIYSSFSWGNNPVSIDEVIKLANENHVLIFLNSISKVFLEPGQRAGVLAVYVPEHWTTGNIGKVVEGALIRNLNALNSIYLVQGSRTSIAALVEAHRILMEEESMPNAELDGLRMEAKRRFVGEDGSNGNRAIMCAIPHIAPLYPDVMVESSGYEVFKITGSNLPWKNNLYKQGVLHKFEKLIGQIDDERIRAGAFNALNYFKQHVPLEKMSPSDIFCLELAMETGVATAPGDRFFMLGTAPDEVMFRTVMIFPEHETRRDAELISEFLRTKLG